MFGLLNTNSLVSLSDTKSISDPSNVICALLSINTFTPETRRKTVESKFGKSLKMESKKLGADFNHTFAAIWWLLACPFYDRVEVKWTAVGIVGWMLQIHSAAGQQISGCNSPRMMHGDPDWCPWRCQNFMGYLDFVRVFMGHGQSTMPMIPNEGGGGFVRLHIRVRHTILIHLFVELSLLFHVVQRVRQAVAASRPHANLQTHLKRATTFNSQIFHLKSRKKTGAGFSFKGEPSFCFSLTASWGFGSVFAGMCKFLCNLCLTMSGFSCSKFFIRETAACVWKRANKTGLLHQFVLMNFVKLFGKSHSCQQDFWLSAPPKCHTLPARLDDWWSLLLCEAVSGL